MAEKREEKNVPSEIAAQREIECRNRVANILQKKETADHLLPFQGSYPTRRNDQAPFPALEGDRKLEKQVQRVERTPNHTNKSFHATPKPWQQRPKGRIPPATPSAFRAHPRSFISPPKPNNKPYSTSAADESRSLVPEASPSALISQSNPRAAINGGKIFCEICKVDCSSPFNYKQHLKGHKHRNKLKFEQLSATGAIGIKKRNKHKKCELCEIWCTDENGLRMHFNGRKHKAKMLDARVLDQKP